MKFYIIPVMALATILTSPAHAASGLVHNVPNAPTIAEAKAEASILERSIRRNPSNLDLRRAYCEQLIKAGLSLDAAKQMQAVVALGQRIPADFTLLADAYRYAGNYQSAIENYQEALGIEPTNAQAKAGMALAYMQAGCPKIAQRVCKEGLANASRPAERRILLAALKNAKEFAVSDHSQKTPDQM